MTLNSSPSASASRRCRESAPRFLPTTYQPTPPGDSRRFQVRMSSSSACLPMRIGGFDQITSNITPSGISAAVTARTRPRLWRAAFSAVSSSARAFTSSAQTSSLGDASASDSAIGPQPQPRSSALPCSGGLGTSCSRMFVALSSRSPLNTDAAVLTRTGVPRNSTSISRRRSSVSGSASK